MSGGRPRTPLSVRWWAKVDREAHPGGCWLWTGHLNRQGYGQINLGGSPGTVVPAHRAGYELLVGPIPDGLQPDHLCRNTSCVNPAHLEPVTARVNILRGEGLAAQNAVKTRCPKGHPYDDENTYVFSGRRHCRACSRDRTRRWRRANPDYRRRAIAA